MSETITTGVFWTMSYTGGLEQDDFDEHRFCRRCGSEMEPGEDVVFGYDHRTGERQAVATKFCTNRASFGTHDSWYVDIWPDSGTDSGSNDPNEAPNRAQEG